MINTSAAYQSAIIADSRKILLRVVVDLISPDITYSAGSSSGETDISNIAQLHNKVLQIEPSYATLEHNRWALDGSFGILPVSAGDEIGFESSAVSVSDCTVNAYAEIAFSNVNILQACSVYFTDNETDGYAVDFSVDVYSGGNVEYTETFTGNTATSVNLTGFTVNNPDAIRVTVTKWSLPNRRVRIAEILAGVYEIWDADDLAGFEITNATDFASASLPYGTCKIQVDNSTGRFSPRNKSGLFQSLEERQGIITAIGVQGGGYVPTGTFYQYSGGWNTSRSGLTMAWNLVDIIGLLASRRFTVPVSLPTTLQGWVAEIVSQLGTNFAGHYTLSGVTGTTSLTTNADAVTDVTCGQILQWICQRACCYMRADATTGYLVLSTLGNAGNTYTLDNLSAYPEESANADVANITFEFPDETKLVITSTSSASPNTLTIKNPFIVNATQAAATAAWIFQFYGGNAISTTGRGDPSTEIGDVVTVEFDNNETAAGRVASQSFKISSGVLQQCKTKLIGGAV